MSGEIKDNHEDHQEDQIEIKKRPQFNEAIRLECLRIEENCTYSSKGHYNASDVWSKAHLLLGLPASTLAAVAGISVLQDNSLLTLILSILVVAFTAVMTFLDPSQKAAQHRLAGNNYLELRNRTRRFRTFDVNSEISDKSLREYIEALAVEQDRLNRESPTIPRTAYEKARTGIANGEATNLVDR